MAHRTLATSDRAAGFFGAMEGLLTATGISFQQPWNSWVPLCGQNAGNGAQFSLSFPLSVVSALYTKEPVYFKEGKVKVAQSCLTLSKDCIAHGILQASTLEWVADPFSRGFLPIPGIKPRSPALQADSLPAEPQGKHKNTGVGSPSLLQWIFLTQELNWGLLHCRWILY